MPHKKVDPETSLNMRGVLQRRVPLQSQMRESGMEIRECDNGVTVDFGGRIPASRRAFADREDYPVTNFMSMFRVTGISTLAVAACVAAPANAQDAEDRGNQLQALRDCRTIEQNEARLTCFDAAVDSVIARQDSGELQVLDKEDVAETRRGLFGFSLPKIGIFSSDDDEENSILQSRITGLRRLRSDHWEIEISEGSVWRATNTPRQFRPEVGDEVELEKAAMTSYWLRVNGALGVKASRIR